MPLALLGLNLEVSMSVVVCPVCRDVVHTSAGYILRHGSNYHGRFSVCSGSGTSYVQPSDCCGI